IRRLRHYRGRFRGGPCAYARNESVLRKDVRPRFSFHVGLEKPPDFLAERASRDVNNGHLHVTSLHIVPELRHGSEADRGNVEFTFRVFFWHLWRGDWLRDEDYSLTPI